MDTNASVIDFESMSWESPAPGVRQKAFSRNGQKMRLVEFSEEFLEPDWCTKGHVGYVLDGRLQIDFNGKIKEYKTGDGLWIDEGAEFRHKGSVAKGEKALLILFEKS